MAGTNDLNLSALAKHFSDEEAAWLLIEALRWPEGEKACPHCGTIGTHYFLKPAAPRKTSTGAVSYRRMWKCSACRKKFSALVGTIFEDSKIPLSKWLLGIYLMCSGKNGVSALELSRQLGITPKSAWHMGHRIRLAMTRDPLASKMTGIVEADETYVGGKARGKGMGYVDNKTPVFALVERGGEVRATVMKKVTRDNVAEVIAEHVDMDAAVLMTDKSKLYVPIGRQFTHGHESVDHGRGEYVRDKVIHSNTIENFFGQLKRSIDGTHHSVGEDHLHRYVDEFSYRYNTRNLTDGQRLIDTVEHTQGRRLTYKPLTSD